MTQKFSKSLCLSKQLQHYRKIIFMRAHAFSVNDALTNIITIKGVKESNILVVANIRHCLHALRLVNIVKETMTADYQKQIFDKNNAEHVALLEKVRLFGNILLSYYLYNY